MLCHSTSVTNDLWLLTVSTAIQGFDSPFSSIIFQHHTDEGRYCILQVLVERGVREEELETAVQAQLAEVAALRIADEGVNMVLLAAAQAEMEALRGQAAEQGARAADLEARWGA